jgi:hypothetical protein
MSDHLKQLASQLVGQVQRSWKQAQRRQAEWAQQREPLRPGDLLLLSPRLFPCHWLLVQPHPLLPSLVLAVPADDFAVVGPADVRAETPSGNWTFRAGFGMWLPLDLMPDPVRAGQVDLDTVRRVQQVVRQLAQNAALTPTEEQQLRSLDPDYYFLLDLVEHVYRNTQTYVSKLGAVYHWALLDRTPPAPAAELAQRLFPRSGKGAAAPRWLALAEQGQLSLVFTDQGVQVFAVPKTQVPPRVFFGKQCRPLHWLRQQACWLSEVWPWQNDRLEVRHGLASSGRLLIYR